jgi:heme A synthase
MSAPPAEARRLAAACAAGLAFVLVVLVVSAAIRLGADDFGANTMKVLRAVHRSAASLEVLAMLAALWFAWRVRANRPAVALAAALTIALSVLGILAGQQPPALAAYGNLTLGLALAAAFAWLLGRTLAPNSMGRRVAHVAAGLLVVQVLLGAWIAMFSETLWSLALLAHGLLGISLAAGAVWLARRIERAAARFALAVLALAVPAAGFASALFEQPLAAGLAHAAAAALFVSAAAYGHARIA